MAALHIARAGQGAADAAAAEAARGAVTDILGQVLIGVDHVGLAVADIDAAVELWSAMGLREVHRERNDEQGVVEVMMAVGAGTTQMQLLAATSDTSPIAAWIDKRGPGIQQVAYAVRDVHAAAEGLRMLGFTLLYELPKRGTHGSLINFVHPKSCGGVLLELVEHIR
ncbi:MAG: methylmalonyl-CoA epimerase [Actinomycetales bacterium]|nr:methylmalonyl-CoA epimerase [Actinomycetales bacterium]